MWVRESPPHTHLQKKKQVVKEIFSGFPLCLCLYAPSGRKSWFKNAWRHPGNETLCMCTCTYTLATHARSKVLSSLTQLNWPISLRLADSDNAPPLGLTLPGPWTSVTCHAVNQKEQEEGQRARVPRHPPGVNASTEGVQVRVLPYI